MRITNPYENEITIVKDFVTPEEQELCLRYFDKFFYRVQHKNSTQRNSDTTNFFALDKIDIMSDEEYQQLKPLVKDKFTELQQRAESVFHEALGEGVQNLPQFITFHD
jgi:hypothetical protein